MKARLTIIVLVLVVLPTAVLSLLAGRAFRAWELVLQDQVETAAARAIQSVWKQLRAEVREEMSQARRAVSGSLARSGKYADVAAVAQQLSEGRALVSNVYLFMYPWGLLYPQGDQDADRLRPGWDFPPKAKIDPGGDEALVLLSETVTGRIEADVSAEWGPVVNVRGIPYCFARLDRRRDLYVGLKIDRGEFGERLSAALARHSGGAFVLMADAGSARAEAIEESREDVVVTDTFSPSAVSVHDEGAEGTVRAELSSPAMPAHRSSLSPLAQARLFAPFESIRITALARDPEELSRAGSLQARLYLWGVLLLAIGIIVGAGFVLREAVAEIRLARAKSDFAIGVSHDLRTPVASMKMLAESLFLEHVPDQAKQKEFLGTIVRECERLSQLIERVLFLVRFGQDALVFRPQAVDPGELAASAVETFNARQTGQDVVLEVANDLPRIKADRSAITQVILNLLDNAAKYGRQMTDDGGQMTEGKGARPPGIRVVVSCVGEGRSRMVRTAVSDSGPGVEAAELKLIFKPFHRGPGAVDSNTSGVGLGLAMCKRIVSEHGGRIEVQSETGKGTTFSVFLPST